jgi:hypothetical protein
MKTTIKDVLEIFKQEIDSDEDSYFVSFNPDSNMFEYIGYVNINQIIDDDNSDDQPICISFYSGCSPAFVAFLIQTLIYSDITDYEIMENIYPDINDDGNCDGLLFGNEANAKYEEMIYKKVRNKKYQNFENSEKEENEKAKEENIG